ncbi:MULTISPECIES: SDR family NAD(P)-dependent oxidoreductase [Brevibacterium]|uniref:SDR family NAD(P)-dependent oxidoreductase n=1 Tax=Brevibacterium TaxID=1696 RepID=UPI001BAC17E9|nr:SDR family NAD(P)-dependent oxidoreductase [Brevibacterium sp. W7.2]
MDTSFFSSRRVVVTGGEGFIGSHLVESLLSAGADVTVFAHYKPYGENGHIAHLLDDVRLVGGDIRDADQVSRVVAGADTVFHLAALIGIPYSYVAPDSYLQTNIAGTRNVAEAVRRHDVRRLVHTSTSEVYGSAITVPISEDHPLQPQSPYSASKIGADMMAMSYFHSFETPVSVCRPFNTYGPRQSARAVIPAILGQIHAGARTLRIGSTTPTRDFTYATDTAAGFMAIAAADAAIGRTLNLGTGHEISVGDLITRLVEISGAEVALEQDAERIRPAGSEVDRLLSDNSLARELTGWAPTTSLRDGLERTWEWVQRQPVKPLGYER